ncbi:hypothetical protein OAH12_01125 [Cyclobacteriaceae bacterium]|nr:hypothetical protein [Cyclobacteriaceae bacterium]
MPRGEHFKKDNPRINQVSFKVNDTELTLLQEHAKKANLSIAKWLRGHITGENTTTVPDISAEISTPKEVVKKATPVAQEDAQPKIEKVTKKAKDYDNSSQNEQMSLF